MWGATVVTVFPVPIPQFQSTHPVWGATCSSRVHLAPGVRISIHAPRVGCDTSRVPPWHFPTVFQSTHPVWGATYHFFEGGDPVAISIHAPRVGCDYPVVQSIEPSEISIHAPRVGCDFCSGLPMAASSCHFNPRTPCGVRPDSPQGGAGHLHFNPRTPCGVRPCAVLFLPHVFDISIHAPRVGCDYRLPGPGAATRNFNPRTPCGVRRAVRPQAQCYHHISIHAPRVGCDTVMEEPLYSLAVFQSTHPVWGATRPPAGSL